MKAFNVGKNEDGMRLDKLLERLLPGMGKGMAYKMLRKKNIVLNGKKADGTERVASGDEVKIFFADETFEKFGYKESGAEADTTVAKHDDGGFDFVSAVIYEDGDVILVNKPAGILTQKAEPEDVSLNEYLIDYLLAEKKITREQLTTFRPSVCNRLDRNTAGIVCCGKSITGLRVLSEMFRSRTVHKYYYTIVKGRLTASGKTKAYITKDRTTNKVTISSSASEDVELIETAWKPVRYTEDGTLAEVELFTGKSHQIRAHLAFIGHPVAGDNKYGDITYNRILRDKYKVKSQLLAACRIVFPECAEIQGISGREFTIDVPSQFFIKP